VPVPADAGRSTVPRRREAPHGFREYIEMNLTRAGRAPGSLTPLNDSQRTRMPPIDEMNNRYARS